ncbi:alpha/beta-hydrolase [Microthyrium microscopicum]|uniref:Carboxylic ester hydrolase n=1 Tax=Microthyrium microscopicum TaxID=703497 RepID=A0A6A6U9H0_9PEZI|nr:alpha/beta-hydrolase [Microthyrium microscopicum]
MISFLSLLLVATASAQQTWTVGQQVKTTSGQVTGHASSTAKEVSEYLGIRYGQTTGGSNRFMAPKKYTGNETIVAAKFVSRHCQLEAAHTNSEYSQRNGCPEYYGGLLSAVGGLAAAFALRGEDCLFLNVWSKPQTGDKKKAVMIWILGGGFSLGETSIYDGALLAEAEDVVVVSMNYRTNMFGFPGAPGIPDQNVGLLDQRLAVEWARDNIAQFGGDPTKMIIFGESAGGSSVDYYNYMWPKDPIVKGFIAQSGTVHMGIYPTNKFAPLTLQAREKTWYNVSATLGCGGPEAGGPASLKCVQSKPATDVTKAIPSTSGVDGVVGFFGPTIDNKYVHSAEDYDKIDASAGFTKLPLLVGSNHNESVLFRFMAGGQAKPEELLGIDQSFRCGAAKAAAARSNKQIPVWRYHFADTDGSASGAALYSAIGLPGFGATHSTDVQPVFGKGKLAKTFQTAWGAFAKDPQNGLSKLGWPKYDPKGNTLVRIANNGSLTPDFVKSTMYDGYCADFKG